ncbi:MAG: preprotein translocase subunit SecE [Acidimicrobiia bacterium]
MNREQKRMMAKQGADQRRPAQARPTPNSPQQERTPPRQFLREVVEELRKVAWPTRREVVNSTIVVMIAVVLMTVFIFLVDNGANQLVRFIYK